MSRQRHRSGRGRGDTGSITPFAVIVSVALLFLAALVIDGSRQLAARARAIAYAEEAARTGAQKINLDEGFVQLLDADATAAVDQYCAAARAADDRVESCETTTVVENTLQGDVASISVEVTVTYDPIMLDLFMWNSDGTVSVAGGGTAHPIEGITEPELDGIELPDPVVDSEPVKPPISIATQPPGEEIPELPPPCDKDKDEDEDEDPKDGPKPPVPPPPCDDGDSDE